MTTIIAIVEEEENGVVVVVRDENEDKPLDKLSSERRLMCAAMRAIWEQCNHTGEPSSQPLGEVATARVNARAAKVSKPC